MSRFTSSLPAIVLLALAVAAPAPAAAQYPATILSLGDSYASGEGALNKRNPNWDKPDNGCHRSRNAWARQLGVTRLRHFACSGAVIDDLLIRGQKDEAPDNVAQLQRLEQMDALIEIDTVLLTIGGNDIDFVGKLKACYVGHKCLRDLDKLDRDLAGLKPRLVDAYGRVADSTWGDLVVVGYPDIFPSRKERFHKCGWLGENPKRGTREKTGVWHLQTQLNRTIKQAAEEADVDFISIRNALDGHELCTKDSYMNKIIGPFGGSKRGHPNADGQMLMADAVRNGLEELYAEDDVASASAVRWRHCADVVFEPNTEWGASNIRAKRIRCRKARRVARASKDMSVIDGPFNYRIGGFRCVGVPKDEGLPIVEWTCKRKLAVVKFIRG